MVQVKERELIKVVEDVRKLNLLEKGEIENKKEFEMGMGVNIRLDDGLPPIENGLERERNRFYDNMIWDIADDDDDWGKPMEKKPFFKKLKDNIVLAYYDFLLILWRIKQKKKRG